MLTLNTVTDEWQGWQLYWRAAPWYTTGTDVYQHGHQQLIVDHLAGNTLRFWNNIKQIVIKLWLLTCSTVGGFCH